MIIVLTKPSQTDREIAQWLSTNPTEAEPGSYPKLAYNVNLPPVVVGDADEEAAMGDAWRTLNVAPLPDVPTVALDPTSDSVAATPETANFHVTITGPGISGTWTAEKTAAWLTIVAPTTPQSVDGNVTYAVAANTGAARTADITVNSKVFTVAQSAGL
jgi:hypothetical protein